MEGIIRRRGKGSPCADQHSVSQSPAFLTIGEDMEILLTDDEVRVLGCLIEKEMATPDYYPLTLNALLNACNQKSNRNPVVCYNEEKVRCCLSGLLAKKAIRQSTISRVPKYEQIFTDSLKLTPREKAVLCVLTLGGPQTTGEIRGRTERLYPFTSLAEVQETLSSLEDMALVTKLPLQPGRREPRYAHLLTGEPDMASTEDTIRLEPDTIIVRKENVSSGDLQGQIDSLRQELESLRREFEAFKLQFD